jgi:hypothetical protein
VGEEAGMADGPTGVDADHSAPGYGREIGRGGSPSLQPEFAEQPIEDAVIGVVVAAGPALEMVPNLVVRLPEGVIEQQIAGREPEIPRDVQGREEECPEPDSEPPHRGARPPRGRGRGIAD